MLFLHILPVVDIGWLFWLTVVVVVFWAQPNVQSSGSRCENTLPFPSQKHHSDVLRIECAGLGESHRLTSPTAGLWGLWVSPPLLAVAFEGLSSYFHRNEFFLYYMISASTPEKQCICLYFQASNLAWKINVDFLMNFEKMFLLLCVGMIGLLKIPFGSGSFTKYLWNVTVGPIGH